MAHVPIVARVLLVASWPRQREMAPHLRVIGQPVGYALHLVEPALAWPSAEDGWSVVVLDGESIATDDEREALLHRWSVQPFVSLLYLAQREPLDAAEEQQQAYAWASDILWPGPDAHDRLRRRVQEVALAPWRRGMAARVWAERHGERRLRLVRPAYAWDREPGSERSLPSAALPASLSEQARRLGPEVVALVATAFAQGEASGADHVRARLLAFSERLERESAQILDAVSAEASSTKAELSARRGGVAFALAAVRSELRARAPGSERSDERS